MKQIIHKWSDGKIMNKYYTNHLGQINGLYIDYYPNGNISWKYNWINGKRFGLDNWYDHDHKPTQISYHL